MILPVSRQKSCRTIARKKRSQSNEPSHVFSATQAAALFELLDGVTGGAQPARFERLVVVPHNDGVAESGMAASCRSVAESARSHRITITIAPDRLCGRVCRRSASTRYSAIKSPGMSLIASAIPKGQSGGHQRNRGSAQSSGSGQVGSARRQQQLPQRLWHTTEFGGRERLSKAQRRPVLGPSPKLSFAAVLYPCGKFACRRSVRNGVERSCQYL